MENFYSIRAAAARVGINHQTANNRIAMLEKLKQAQFPRRINVGSEEIIVPESMLPLLRQKPVAKENAPDDGIVDLAA